MTSKAEFIDEILKNAKDPTDFKTVWNDLQKTLLEKMLQGEMTNHLGYEKNEKGKNLENSRNGKTKKSVASEFGEMEVEIPRDRNSEFEPKIIQKGQRRFKGFDDKIIAMYGRGMTTREIQATLQ